MASYGNDEKIPVVDRESGVDDTERSDTLPDSSGRHSLKDADRHDHDGPKANQMHELQATTTQENGAASGIEKSSVLDKRSTKERKKDNQSRVYPNGYTFPPKRTFGQAMSIGTKAFATNVLTTFWGWFWTIYGLLVVAWGGMLFLLLCNAGPAMCVLGDGSVDCNDINSARRVWIEIDSQILTVLFCVPAFGLLYWRARDFYHLMRWRALGDQVSQRRLAGWHKSWFRLRGSEAQPVPAVIPEDRVDPAADLDNPAYPTKAKYVPLLPLTGERATPTAPWRMDFLIWSMVMNTAFQVVLCVFMWHDNRYTRPSWATGLFVALGCIAGMIGGFSQFREGRRVQATEGIPWSDADKKLAADRAASA